MNIKKVLKYGVVAGCTAIATKYIGCSKEDTNESYDKDKLWLGETTEVKIDIDMAEVLCNTLNEVIRRGEYPDKLFAKDDVKDVRTKLSHGIAEAKSNGNDDVVIELPDRKRLRFLDVAVLQSEW